MPINFKPIFTITSKIINSLMRIEAAKEKVLDLPLTPTVLKSLRETARLYTTHYSTMIEGNRLEPEEIKEILKHQGHFPGRERDESEIKGYYAALTQVEKWATTMTDITEKIIKITHFLVTANGKTSQNLSPYRDGQNVIRDGRSGAIVYMPPEAKDVKKLMQEMVVWINANTQLPCPIVAAITHYQFATIHPYYDGNGRTARLLTTLILHQRKYDLKGLYSLEEYYARDLNAYYQAISVGDSHNYYMGRASADITNWIEYFLEGMATSFEKVLHQMAHQDNKSTLDQSDLLKTLDPRKRKALELFQESNIVTSRQIGELFGFKPRTCAKICNDWVKADFLTIVDHSKKGRKYSLSQQYQKLFNK